MLAPDTRAPRFELQNQDGATVALPESGTVIVYFYPRADTPGCTAEACSFRDRWDEFRTLDIRVFGISDDSVKDLFAFREKFDLPIELLSDKAGEVASAYESYGKKTVFGNEVVGVFRNTYVVQDGEIVLVYEGVSPEDHAAEVLEDLSFL